MTYFILALMVIAAAMVITQAQRQGGPANLWTFLELAGGIVLAGLAFLLAFTGRLLLAIPLGAAGLALLLRVAPSRFPGKTSTGGANRSNVQTEWLMMSLDHDTGEMEGHVLHGRFEGRPLAGLSESEALQFRVEVDGDPQSAQLVEAFLDRTFPDWRERYGGAADSADGPMTREKAFEVLGLEPGATADDIRAAHRELMKKLHPDHGGSTWMATQVNAAKDLLLG